MELTAIEARVVGALVEKAAVTPDIYPMTTNAIVSACNQKTARDPVVAYDAKTVDAALLELRQRNVVRRVHTQGSRATKHRHTLDELLELDPGELAVVAVLLLRGDQTVGELRSRTERQFEFESLEAVDAVLEGLAGRPEPLVRRLERRPGQKEARWQHLLGDPDDAAFAPGEATGPAGSPAVVERSEPTSSPDPSARTWADSGSAGSANPAGLVERVESLEAELATLRRQLRGLAEQLGETLD